VYTQAMMNLAGEAAGWVVRSIPGVEWGGNVHKANFGYKNVI